jgi:nucleoside-diphosphate-sugar epimerase
VAPELARRNRVRALARRGSERRLPGGCDVVWGDALDAGTFASAVPPSDTFVHLVGTPHPSPAKAREFVAVDLASVRASVMAATGAGIEHFVYVSVAQPAPVMKAYVAARAEGESAIAAAGLRATLLRPWYVLGPGHRWAHGLVPLYWIAERIPSTRDTAQRLGLVTLAQVVAALVYAVEHPTPSTRIVAVPEIRRGQW